MPDTRFGPTSSTEQREVRVPCSGCGRITKHLILKAIEFNDEWREGTFSVDSWSVHQIIECRGCGTVSFRSEHSNSEELEPAEDAGSQVPVVEEKLYPSRVSGRKTLENTHFLPYAVQRIYGETREALGSGLRVLGGIGLRALVEAVCNERSASGHNLERRIDALVSQGVLTSSGAEILHSLRLIGNAAAHEVIPPSEADLLLGLDVVEHLLTGVYILPAVSGNLPRRAVNEG